MSIQVPIDFEGKFDKLLENFDKLNSNMQKKTKQTEKSLDIVGAALTGIVAKFTFDKILQAFDNITEKATQAEEANRLLTTSLVATGDATAGNVFMFRKLADELSQVSRFDDEAILGQVSIAKQFGVTNKEAAKLIRVAADLASATGMDLTSAVRTLGMTLDGTAGKLANQFPILQKLTAEQLRNGDAVDLLGKMYAGAAARSIDGYKGKNILLGHAFDNLYEAMGTIITQNPAVLASITTMTANVAKLTTVIVKNGETLSSWLSTLLKVVGVLASPALVIFLAKFKDYDGTIGNAVDKTKLFGDASADMVKKFNPITGKFEKFNQGVKAATGAVEGFNFVTGKIADSFDETGTKFNRFVGELKKQFEELDKQLKDIGTDEGSTLYNAYAKNIQLITDAQNAGVTKRLRAEERLGQLQIKYTKEAAEIQKKKYSELSQLVQDAYANPERAITRAINPNENDTGPLSENTNKTAAAAAGIIKTMFSGADGAGKAVGKAVGAVATAFLGPIGGVIGDLVSEFSKGPEYVKEMFTQFFDALPDVIANIIEGIAMAIEVILEKLPDIILRIVDRLPDIIEKLLEHLPDIVLKLVTAVLKLAILLPLAIGKAFLKIIGVAGQFVFKILQGAVQFIGKILEGAGKFISELIKGAGKIFSFGKGGTFFSGSGGGFGIGGNKGLLGGGIIKGFLKGGGGGGGQNGEQAPIVVNMQVGNKALATAMLDLSKLGYAVGASR